MKRFGSIYLITNILTNKQYVGQTQNSVQQRFYDHCRDKRSSRYLSSAIIKHGKENFKIEELLVCFDEDSLNTSETYFIKLFNTLSPEGYNLSLGGHQRGIISEITRQKMSIAKKGKTFIKKIKPTEAQKINASKQRGGTPIVATNIKTGEQKIYITVHAAQLDGFSNGDIYRVLKGKRQHVKGWSFVRFNSKYDNQSGSTETNNSEHAQRIGLEPAAAE